MASWDAEELASLRWHWHGAYTINGSDDVWSAKRTDNGATLRAESPDELLGKIREDYAARPVARPVRLADVARIGRKFSG